MNRIRKNSSQCINSTSNCKTCNCWSNVTYSCCELLKLKSSCQHHTSARMHAVRQQRWFLFKLNWSCCVCVADRLSSVWLLTSAPLNFEESTSLLRSMHSSVCIVLTMLISEWSSAGGVVCTVGGSVAVVIMHWRLMWIYMSMMLNSVAGTVTKCFKEIQWWLEEEESCPVGGRNGWAPTRDPHHRGGAH